MEPAGSLRVLEIGLQDSVESRICSLIEHVLNSYSLLVHHTDYY